MFRKAVLALIALAGLGGATGARSQAMTEADRAVPRYAHVIVIYEENKNYAQILDPAMAPNIAALAQTYGNATQFFGEVHPSEANYVALLGGDTFGIHDDDAFFCHAGVVDPFCAGSSAPGYVDHTLTARNLGQQLQAAGLTWKGYYEDLPAPGSLAVTASDPAFNDQTRKTALYASKHSGFINFAAVQHDPRRAELMVDFHQLDADLKSNRLPNFAMVVPNQCNEMHGLHGPNLPDGCESGNAPALIARGDRIVGDLVRQIQATAAAKRGPGNVADRHHLRRRLGQDPRRLLRGHARRAVELRRRPYPDHRGHQPRPARRARRHAVQPLFPVAHDRGRVRPARPPRPRGGHGQGRRSDGEAVLGGSGSHRRACGASPLTGAAWGRRRAEGRQRAVGIVPGSSRSTGNDEGPGLAAMKAWPMPLS